MTALPAHAAAIDVDAPRGHSMHTPDFSRLIAATEAASLLNMNAGSLRRRCAEEWGPRGLAFHVADPRDGKVKWFVFRGVDRRLAGGAVGEAYRGDREQLARFTQEQVREALRRAAAAEAFRFELEQRADEKLDQWLPGFVADLRRDPRYPERISRSRLYAWRKAYRVPADLPKLIDRRGGDFRSGGDPAAWAHFREIYLDERQPSVKWCWEQTRAWARSRKIAWCSLSSCRQQLDARVPPDQATAARKPKAYRDAMQPRIEQDPDGWGAGRRWDGDHSQLDFWVRPAGGGAPYRPWLTVWMDWRSRKIVGWVISDSPNSSTILAAFRQAIRDPDNFGGPDEVRIDNGRDYDAWVFHGQTKTQRKAKVDLRQDEVTFAGIYGLLGIDAHFTLPFSPTSKGRVERWFGTVHDRFDRTWDTYTGASADQRPEGLTKLLKDPANAPTIDRVREELAKFIAAYNARADHQMDDLAIDGVKASPAAYLASCCDRRRVLPDESVLSLMDQRWEKPVRVGKNGITIAPFGVRVSYGAFDPALAPYKAMKAKDRPQLFVSFDEAHPGVIQVYDAQWRWVCEARENERGGSRATDRAQARAAQRAKREYENAKKIVRQGYKHELLSPAELMEDQAARAEQARQPQAEPREVALRLTGDHAAFEEAAKQRQRATIRRAAGGEGFGGTHLDLAGRAADDQGGGDAVDWDAVIDDRRRAEQATASGPPPRSDDVDDVDFTLDFAGPAFGPPDTDVDSSRDDDAQDGDGDAHMLELLR